MELIPARRLDVSGRFEPATVRHLAHMTKAVYGNDFKFAAGAAGWQRVDMHRFGPVDLGIAEIRQDDQDHIFLFFRGTQGFRDAVIDLMAWKSHQRRDPGKIHYGFRRYHDYSRAGVKRLLIERSYREKTVTLVGHSLGAFAAIRTAQAIAGRAHIRGVYAFGCPRGFDAAARDHYTSRPADRAGTRHLWSVTHRIVAVGKKPSDVDLVTRVQTRRAGFRHVGRPSYLGVDGTVYTEAEIYARTVTRFEVLRTLWNLGDVKYHHMSTYCDLPYEALENRRKENPMTETRLLPLHPPMMALKSVDGHDHEWEVRSWREPTA